MSAQFVPWAIGAAVFAIFVLVILNLTLAARSNRQPPAADPAAGGAAEHQAEPAAQGPEAQEAEPAEALAVPSLPDLDRLRRLPGVRGVALWGAHGAVLRAEGDLLGTILPEGRRLLETLRQAGASVGSGAWMSFRVEGLNGTIYGARMRQVSLVAVVDPSADPRQIERHLYEATLGVPASLLEGGEEDSGPELAESLERGPEQLGDGRAEEDA